MRKTDWKRQLPAGKKRVLRRETVRFVLSLVLTVGLLFICFCPEVRAAPGDISIDLNTGDATDSFGVLDILFMATVLALLPSVLIMMTSFTRIIIVLSFLRNAMGTQQSPPNQVLVGLALFMTLFIMMPVLTQMNEDAFQPLQEGRITQEEALERASVPLKQFMIKQVYTKDLNLFLDISKTPQPFETADGRTNEELMQLGMEVVIPAFITSELKHAFIIGFLLFLPFLVIDMVVSSTLMSMGMVMLPPSMISLPFKIMIFVLVDGWDLLVGSLISGFQM